MPIDTVTSLSSSVKKLLVQIECVIIVTLIISLTWNVQHHHGELQEIYVMHGTLGVLSLLLLLFIARSICRLLDIHRKRVVDSVDSLESLKQNNRLLAGVIDSFNNPLMVVDPKTKLIKMSNSAAHSIGWDKGLCCQSAFWDCHNQCGDDMALCPLRVVNASHEEYKKSLSVTIRGRNHYVQLNSFPVLDHDGNVAEVIMYFIDLTDYREALQSLEERKVKYWGLFESCPVSLWEEDFSDVKRTLDELRRGGVTDIEKYLEKHPEFVHECACMVKINDINTQTLLLHKAESKTQLLDSLQVTFGPDAYSAFRLQLLKIWKHDHNLTCEATVLALDGEKFEVILYWQVLPGSEDDYSNIVVSLVDVTESKNSFRELAKRERALNRLSLAVEQSPSTIVVTSTRGDIEFVNNSVLALTGYDRKELIGQNPRILKSGEFDDSVYESLWKTLMNGGTWKGTFHNKRKDGSFYWEESSISPIIDVNGEISGYLKVGEDVTARLEAETMLKNERANLAKMVDERTAELQGLNLELAQANKHKSEFIANISHELRTPLNGILGYSQILQRGKGLAREELHGVRVIQQCGESLLELINEILDMSKVEAGKLTFEKSIFSFPFLLYTLEKLFAMKALDKGIPLECRFDKDLPGEIEFDQQRLRQVLSNLLNNAINYTDSGKVVFTVIRSSDNRFTFDVSDTGTGINNEELIRIFEPFYQVKGDEKFREGTGLGLAISYKIVELFHSQLHVESEVGRGTRFWFDIECAVVDNQSSSQDRNVQRGLQYMGYKGDRKTILIVDDIEVNRMLLVAILNQLDFTLDEAETGQEAIDKITSKHYDLVLLDMKLPDMHGTDVVEFMKHKRECDNTRVIAISAGVFESNIKATISAGCDAFIGKPFKAVELIEKIGELLNIELESSDKIDELNDCEVDLSRLTNQHREELFSSIKRGSLSSIIDILTVLEKENIISASTFTALNEITMNFDFSQLKEILHEEGE